VEHPLKGALETLEVGLVLFRLRKTNQPLGIAVEAQREHRLQQRRLGSAVGADDEVQAPESLEFEFLDAAEASDGEVFDHVCVASRHAKRASA